MTVLVCAENLYSGPGGQFPAHVISATSEPAGGEAWRVGNARRSRTPPEYATATTANLAWRVRSVFDRVRAFNFWAIDRGHNLAGKTFEGRVTSDATDFTGTFETPFDITMPSVVSPNSHIDNGLGVRTEEGAWIKRHPIRTGKAVELFIDTMGAGIKPEIVGLWVGLAIELGFPDRPHDEDAAELLAVSQESEGGVIGRGRRTRRRRGQLKVKLNDFASYEGLIRYQIAGLFADGVPMWVVPNIAQAERAFLAIGSEGVTSIPYPADDAYREINLGLVEYAPKAF